MSALLEEHEDDEDQALSSDADSANHGSGHTTKEALQILHDELLDEIDRYEYQNKKLPLLDKFLQSDFHHKCVKSMFHWTDCLIMVVTSLFLFIAFGLVEHSDRHVWLLIEGLIILLLFIVNIYITSWNAKLKRKEVIVKTRKHLLEIKSCIKHNIWYPSHYLNLNSPLSPCVSVQWTFRDNELVNLPCNFLVKGDLILLRPGQEVLIHCKSFDKDADGHAIEEYSPSDIYLPKADRETGSSNVPKGRRPHEPKPYVMTETPFVTSLRTILEDSQKRPNSTIHNLLYQVRTFFVQIWALPIFLAVSFIVNLVRYIYLKDNVGEWSETLLVLQVHTVLPMVPLVFPLFYLLVNNYGAARVSCIFERALQSRKPTINICEDASSISEEDAREDLELGEVFQSFKHMLFGHSDILHRTTDLVHVLGSVTSMCCVDKKGILSWPIPVAEKVFFLTTKKVKRKDKDESEERSSGVEEWEDDPGYKYGGDDMEEDSGLQKQGYMQEGAVEVLDVTHDPQSPYGLLFDDPNWKNQISSLKPLGLNILLNTCNQETAHAYTKFADHVTCSSHKKEDTVAVVNRRCLCELAKQIGFSDQVLDLFDLQMTLGMFRHAHPEATNDRLFRSKSFIRHKTPMPNISTVVVKEKTSGMLQLMTQGTADMLLDLCTDYWDGRDLVPLTDNDRKKILDFYHRQSMSAYCSAFSYCPLSEKISPKLKDVYIELPEHGLEIYEFRSPTPTKLWDMDTMDGHISRRRLSVDSLLNTKDQLVTDVDSCFRAQCNQIFIGMVTMQYHAKQDIVQLIEQLEASCIRFVHFSKENELRSRVFSEKVGLEAGWNCHISLLSEENIEVASSNDEKNADVGFDELQISDDTPTRRLSAPAALDKVGLISHPPKAVTIRKGSHDSLQVVVIDGPENLESSTDHIDVQIDAGLEECGGSSQELEGILEDKMSNTAASSHLTENTDDSIPFDVFNRAKLPKGIENIRPHLKNVDNVPLLVSLFTDCTPEVTQEMIKIMQESGEVVCVIGSLTNILNTPLFLQADISVGIKPLYPPVCTKHSPIVEIWDEDFPSPMEMSAKLATVPCSLSFEREDNVNFIKLIAEARHQSFSMKNCFQFLLSCYLTLSFTQLFTSIFVLPPILSGHHVLWMVCLTLPCLAVALIATEVDPLVMTMALGKNKGHLKGQVILEYFLYYSVRYLPSMAVVIVCYGMTLYSMCYNQYDNCHPFYGNLNHTIPGTWNGLQTDSLGGYAIAQNFAAMQLVLYLCGISSSYVYRQYHLWKKPPTDNILWCIVVPVLLALQCIYFAIDVSILNPQGSIVYYLSDIPTASWCVALIWALLIVPVNELAKMREIKLWVRYQKRARLDFGTKLGMNSPF